MGYLCEKFGVSRAAYYASTLPSPARERQHAMAQLVTDAFTNGGGIEGYRKVAARLHRDGVKVNPKTVASHMQVLGLVGELARRQFKVAARRAARTPDPVDLVARNFTAETPGQVLVGDITYVATGQGWLYVATVIDLACRKVIGYAQAARQDAKLPIRALQRAHASGLIQPGAVFHSDHGTQYRSVEFTRACGVLGVRRSMGSRFQCWDNAVAESFFSKLKNECVNSHNFTTRAQAKARIAAYVDYFNDERLHQTLGYRTPNEQLALLLAEQQKTGQCLE